MERTLTSFVRALRSAGAEVSSAEAIDAARVIALMGYEDRDALKISLSVALAKSEEEKEIHDNLFELYFSRPKPKESGKAKKSDNEDESEDQSSDADQAGGQGNQQGQGGAPRQGGQGGGGGDPGEREADQAGGLSDAEREAAKVQALRDLAESGDGERIAGVMERAGAAVGVDDIRFSSQTAYYVRRMLEQIGIEALENRLSVLLRGRGGEGEAEEAEALMQARSVLQRHARSYVDQRYELFGKSATEAFMNEVATTRSIGELSVRDMERMKVVVARMAKRLAVRHARRRRVLDRSHLDLRRTLRANAGHDGVPFDLIWKRKRKDRPKIVAICDVSGSVASYVRFLLLFLYMLREKVTDLSAFAFSNQLVDVGRTLETLGFDAAMKKIIDEVGSGSTDYGRALEDLHNHHWEVIDKRTTILVLGDGRSNYGDPRLDIVQEAADRAKRLVWLCPEPPARWGSGDSCMLQYKPFCSPLSHCSTAADLEQAVDDILLAYD